MAVVEQPDPIARAQAWARADAPTIWLLGKTQSGKTSIVAEITDQAHDQIGTGYVPVTRASRLYAFPAANPVLRFLDTRGLGDVEDYDRQPDLEQARQQSHLLLAVARADDLELHEILEPVRAARRRHPDWPVLVAQTMLHNLYGPQDLHPEPYPFDGSAADFQVPRLPDELRCAMQAQRRLFQDGFERLPGAPPVFIPLDFTQPEQGLPPVDYGAERLWTVLEDVLPDVVARLKASLLGASDQRIRTRIILPWALAAAAANALPLPVMGGLGSAGLQAAMVNRIARRLGIPVTPERWRAFAAALGSGFALGFAGRWLAQQGLKLAPGWGTAAVASWTFAITWGVGEAALYYFGEQAAGRVPDPQTLAARYRAALRQGRAIYRQRKQESTP